MTSISSVSELLVVTLLQVIATDLAPALTLVEVKFAETVVETEAKRAEWYPKV